MRWLRDWSARKLVLAWIGYWIALVIVGLAPAIPFIWRATHAGPAKASVSLNYGSGAFTLTMTAGSEVWNGSVSVIALALWIGVPPLLLWAAWLTQRAPVAESSKVR
jgi:hypothetical protein